MGKMITRAVAIGLFLFATIQSGASQTALSIGDLSLAQAEKPSAASQRSVRARFEAVKTRLSQDQEKFRECSLRLDEAKKKHRMHIWKQIEFLEDCMQKKL